MNTLVAGLVAGLVAFAASTALAAPAHAEPEAPAPAPGPHAAYLNGLTLHTRSDRVEHVPLHGKYAAYTTLIGHAPQGWVLLGSDFHYYLFAHGQVTKLAQSDDVDEYVTRLLGDDGNLIWESTPDQADDVEVHASDLSGHGAGSWELDYHGGDVLAAHGDVAWVGGDSLVELVRKHDGMPAQQIEVDRRHTDLVDSRQDVVFLHDKGLGDGPTSLSAPGALAWHAKQFLPLNLSRHGTYVAGVTGSDTVEIRRMSDGAVVQDLTPAYDYADGEELGWASDTVLLYDVVRHGRSALEQCDVTTGACSVATAYSRYGYSLPDSIHFAP